VPLRSGTFRSGLSPFGNGVLPPFTDLIAAGVISPPGSTPPRPGPAPTPPGKAPPRGGTIPTVQHVAVRHVPRPGIAKPKPVAPKPPPRNVAPPIYRYGSPRKVPL
jgi:hypothetical protein